MNKFVIGFACGVLSVFGWAFIKLAEAEAVNLKENNAIPFPSGKWNPSA